MTRDVKRMNVEMPKSACSISTTGDKAREPLRQQIDPASTRKRLARHHASLCFPSGRHDVSCNRSKIVIARKSAFLCAPNNLAMTLGETL